MFGNVRLLLPDRHLDIAHAPLLLCQDLKDAQPCRLSYGLKELRLNVVPSHGATIDIYD